MKIVIFLVMRDISMFQRIQYEEDRYQKVQFKKKIVCVCPVDIVHYSATSVHLNSYTLSK